MSMGTLHVTRLAAAASIASAFVALGGCSGGAGDGAGSGATPGALLHGDYLRAASSSGTIQEIDFVDSAHYAMLPVGCTAGEACEQTGTYTYDGGTLTLKDGASGATTELPIAVLSTVDGTPATSTTKSDAHALAGVADLVSSAPGGSLVTGGSTPLVSGTNAQLVTMATACPSGQTCAGSMQAGDSTLVAMGSPGKQGGSSGTSPGDDDGDDSSNAGSGSGGGGRPSYTGPCFLGSSDICQD